MTTTPLELFLFLNVVPDSWSDDTHLELKCMMQNILFREKNTRKVGETGRSIMQHFLSAQWKSHF
jgi:hypothetical protein